MSYSTCCSIENLSSKPRRIDAYISAITPVNVFYIARKLKGGDTARRIVAKLLIALRVCPVDESVLRSALNSSFTDYEDAVQHHAATASLLDAVITRNTKDYKAATLPVFTPTDFLSQMNERLKPPHE